jgi:RNA polymerase sigma-54 factor
VSFTLELAMTPRFGLEVSPALIAFSELLLLPYPAMQSVIEDELCANAALERLEVGECPICRGTWRTRCPVCSVPAGRDRDVSDHRLAEVPDRPATEPDTEALRHAVRMETADADCPIADYLVDSLDEHGLLDRSCAEVAAELGVTEPAVARVLNVIRRCGPAGIGATSVAECLLFQLDALHLADDRARLVRAVIAGHLPALAKGHLAAIARALGVSRAEVEQALELIRQRLSPYPAFDGNTPAAPRYVVPDLVVRRDEPAGTLTVELVEPALSRLGLRHGPRPGDGPVVPGSVPQARSFLAQLRDRWETLRRVAEYTVHRQEGFLRDGTTALTPLTRAEVAAALDLHESTVSRAIADKYALLPDRTTVPLSRFFGVSGGVDGQLGKLLESADGPMSDQRLADLLRDAGYPIARRTVAKHRARLGFPRATTR